MGTRGLKKSCADLSGGIAKGKLNLLPKIEGRSAPLGRVT